MAKIIEMPKKITSVLVSENEFTKVFKVDDIFFSQEIRAFSANF